MLVCLVCETNENMKRFHRSEADLTNLPVMESGPVVTQFGKEFVVDILTSLIDETTAMLLELKVVIENNNHTEYTTITHKIQSSCLFLHLHRLAAVALVFANSINSDPECILYSMLNLLVSILCRLQTLRYSFILKLCRNFHCFLVEPFIHALGLEIGFNSRTMIRRMITRTRKEYDEYNNNINNSIITIITS
jgi:hypothetical protein